MKRPRKPRLHEDGVRPGDLVAGDLLPGDLLLSTTMHWQSWLIRWLDGGSYSQAGLYDGERVIIAGVNGIERRPLSTADVFRFQHDSRPLGEGGLDFRVLLDQARPYLDSRNTYGYTSLYLVGLLMIMRRFARPSSRRVLVEVFGGLLLMLIRRSIDRHFPSGVVALTCSELVTRIFCDAGRISGRPYDILIELDGARARGHEWPAWPPTSGRFERLMQEIDETLSRVNPELSIAVSRARSAAPGGANTVVSAGGPLAPACFVSPGDLQHSASFVRVGRVVAEPASARLIRPRLSAGPPS